jgi:hypothetical protein
MSAFDPKRTWRGLSLWSFEPLRSPIWASGDTMRRREFITLIGGAAAWPFMARAQQTYRLGVLSGRGRQEPNFVAFFDELEQFGIIEGKNLKRTSHFATHMSASDP